ncbi:MAG: class I SAM-dependent methyltransferase [Chloroflexales bacterium]|nr:class I SAM-dependent methyltransferase [Chloroflexales bacterium]
MPDYRDIYQNIPQAQRYHQLVSREDYQGNLLYEIRRLCNLAEADALDMGCGTGRVAALLAPHVRNLTVCDRAPAMLSVARQVLPAKTIIMTADNRDLPLPDACFDLVTAGWSFGHATEWIPGSWQVDVRAAIGEMLRVLRPGGVAIIFETLGSGADRPAPPTTTLADCYSLFVNEFGFHCTPVSTDYRFISTDEAAELTEFFFGMTLTGTRQPDGTAIVPEWTGAFSLRV